MKKISFRAFVAGTALAVTAAVGLAPRASAATLITSGTVGYVGLPTATCTFYDAWNRLDVKVSIPAIYAPNVTAGGGNDAAWARYQVMVVDRYHQVVRTSSLSGWAVSYDNQPAAFSGAPVTFTGIPEFSTVRIGVEWSYGGPNSGAAIHKLDQYLLYSGGIGPYGGLDSCSKWIWRP
jgi:hypothetical protein